MIYRYEIRAIPHADYYSYDLSKAYEAEAVEDEDARKCDRLAYAKAGSMVYGDCRLVAIRDCSNDCISYLYESDYSGDTIIFDDREELARYMRQGYGMEIIGELPRD